MKRLMESSRIVLLLVLVLSCTLCAMAQTASEPATAPIAATATEPTVISTMPAAAATQPASQPADSRALYQAAMDKVLSGDIDEGTALLQSALKVAPEDPTLKAGSETLEKYLANRAQSETRRRSEYKSTVQRVEWSMLAQKAIPQLQAKGVDKDLRQKATDLITAYNKVPLTEILSGATDDQTTKMKDTATVAFKDSIAASQAAVATLKDDSSQYARLLKTALAELVVQLKKNQQVWADLKPTDEKSRNATADTLTDMDDAMMDAVSNVEALISEHPWKVGLLNARLAKQIAIDSDKMTEQAWYKALIADIEARGAAAMQASKWYDALTAFTGLEDLDHDNETYKDTARKVRTHVRALRLYGGPDALNAELADAGEDAQDGEGAPAAPRFTPTSQPATKDAKTQPAQEIIKWEDLVQGVDLEMVRSAITKLNELYVTKPDYRKIIGGALETVKVLAQTPQASHSFPKLADPAKRKEFVANIDRLIANAQSRTNVDYLDLQLALNNIRAASDATVEIPEGVLAVEFADGMLEEMDKFSAMIWPHDMADFEKQTMGNFSGIGIQIAKDPGEPLKVVTPLPGTPAYKAGVKTGDLVISIDGHQTQDLSVDKLVGMIMGEQGTAVSLKVKRRGVAEPMDFSIVRDKISIRTIKGWRPLTEGEYDYMIDPANKIAYMRITQFTEQTIVELDQVLRDLKKAGCRSLIMDLRFNPGGLLRSAGQVCDEFLSSGRIVSTRSIQQPRSSEINAEPGGNYLDGNLVVLVNEMSASAAEIVSGAMKDWHRAIIVGERSYGKGSVQNVIPIPRHKAYLKLTTAYYYLPSGRCLHRRNGDKVWGVDPDVRVMITPRQMKHWLDIRRKVDILQDSTPEELNEELSNQYKNDLQLETAVMVLRMMQLKPALAAPSVAKN